MSKITPLTFNQLVKSREFLVLDTETTGLHDCEICQIAVIDGSGAVLHDLLIQPVNAIPADATRIHGITNAMVHDSPGWYQVYSVIADTLKDRPVLIYNTRFDVEALYSSTRIADLPAIDWWSLSDHHDVMQIMAPIVGEWNEYHGNYKWPALWKSLQHFGLPQQNDHTALGDALATLAVARAIAGDIQDVVR